TTIRAPWIAVVGPSAGSADELAAAEEVGAAVAEAGAVLVCGGLGGAMEAACRGARSKLGMTVGILPGGDRGDANGWVQLAIPTGMGEARNTIIVRSADAVIAVGGGWGTLSEIGFALRLGVPVFGLSTWDIGVREEVAGGVVPVETPQEAVARAMAAA